MTINIKDLKNKIIYRANYRGTKEMDKLLGSFTKKYINLLNEEELFFLCDLYFPFLDRFLQIYLATLSF